MTLQSSPCNEALPTTIPLTDMSSLIRMCTLDVLLQMLVFDVIFITAIVRALPRSRVGVRV